ncbi:hypothetical protein SCHPADRAFT_871032 [Schizopora paradoxa]|uniref:Cytochrome b-c1 complex subunit 8 n=1 Tax=Schizopora paradoxa TaxID=27342 RepID=A0A0H2RUM1_9AGAM|nr:hypothetical protein SCHPADRAFT_871032 [Schizopora paradoxa]
MRPTQVRMLSEMPNGKHYMGWWGDMGSLPQKGIIQYSPSPYRQRAMAHWFSNYLFNGFRRVATHLPFVVPPFAIGYGIYAYAKSFDAYQSSKAGHIAAMEKGGGHH